MFGIRFLNNFLARNLKYILVSIVMVMLAILTDYWIDRTTSTISTFGGFFKNTAIIILWLVPFSIISGFLLKYANLVEVIKLNEFFKKYLVILLITGFILIGIILNVRYSKFTQETEGILRSIPFINKALKFFGMQHKKKLTELF